jgi:hypothetical protein
MVQQSGKTVSSETVEKARLQGTTDLEIHDTVLIAAAFCMYNRYVDSLAHGSVVIQPGIPAWVSIPPPTCASLLSAACRNVDAGREGQIIHKGKRGRAVLVLRQME